MGKVACINPKTNIPDNFKYVDLESVVGTSLIKAKLTTKQLAPSRAQRVAKKGDIFYQTVRPYQKNNFLFDINNYDFQYVFSTGYAQLRSEINNYFLFSYLQRQRFVNLILRRSTGTSYPAISSRDLSEIKIIFPRNSKEQENIGKIINLIDALITLQQRKMEQLKQLKKAMLQQLFVNKNNKQPILKFKNFRNNWREYKLSEIVNLEDNKRKPVKATERIRGKIPYYGANGIQDYVKGYTHIGKHVLIAEDGANSVDDYPIYFIYSPSWINNHTHVLTAKEEILSSEFLAYALKKINYAKYLVGSGRYKLNAEILKLIPLKIPTMNEQKYIESNLSKIDKLIALQQNKLTQLTALKKYLLQKLFIRGL